LFTDTYGDLWIGTDNAGMDRYNPVDDTFDHFIIEPEHLDNADQFSITSIFEDSQRRLWVGTPDTDSINLNRNSGEFKHYQIPGQDEDSGWIYTMVEDTRPDLGWHCRGFVYLRYYLNQFQKFQTDSRNQIQPCPRGK